MEATLGEKTIRLEQGDITRQSVDAIANAANSRLAGGGGVDGAIHRAAGPKLMDELRTIRDAKGGCPTGSAVVTGAYDLSATYVFHAVGPVWKGGDHDEPELLASAYRACLELATEHDVKTLAFPSISTGVYAFPLEKAAPIAIDTVATYLASAETSLEEVTFVLFDARTFAAYEDALTSRS